MSYKKTQKCHNLKLATFAGTKRLTLLNFDHFEGNVFECIAARMEYVSKGINWRVEFDGSVQRKEIPEIPLEALREIIVNAFAHAGCISYLCRVR